ncbi:MAG: hypothetical protein ABR541_01125, partial [Candidatus Dormibacteria bacterium]
HLAANTGYTVTIAHTVARDAAGQAPRQDIQVSFGTASTPSPVTSSPPAPAAPPVFTVTALGPVARGSHLDVLPDGSVVVSGAPPPRSATQTPAPTPVVGPAGTPAPTGATPGASSPSTPPVPSQVLRYPGGMAGPLQLGAGGGRVAVSDDGRLVATLAPASSGGASVSVVDASGGQPTVLAAADSVDGPLVWVAPDSVEYVSAGRLRSVNLQGTVHTLTPQPVGSGQVVVPAPEGHTVYFGPTIAQPLGELVDLGSLQSTPLPGASGQVVFSGDGTRLTWVDHSQPSARVLVAAVADPATTTTVATLHGPDSVAGIALSAHGRRVAVAHANGALRAVEVATGNLLASTTLSLDGDLAWAPSGDRLAAVRRDAGGDSLVVAALPGTQSAQPLPDQVPDAAASALNAFLSAQVGASTTDLSGLVGPGVDLGRLQAAGANRYYVIRDGLQSDGTVSADARLVADARDGAPVRSATESLALTQTGGRWLVSSVTASPLQPEPSGPQVVHVSSALAGGLPTVHVSFDSDLDPGTVVAAVSVRGSGGANPDAAVTYDADTRTIVVVVNDAPPGGLQLVIGTGLRDVSGQHLASQYTSPV